MKKKIILSLLLVIIFSLIFISPASADGERLIFNMGGKRIILISEEEITPPLLRGYAISLERLRRTWMYDKYDTFVLHHTPAMEGQGTGTTVINKGTYKYYGHFYDGKRDVSKKDYR